MCRVLHMRQDLLHHLMDTGEIALVDGKLVFVDEEKTRQRLQDEISQVAADEGHTARAEVLARAIMRRLCEQMSH